MKKEKITQYICDYCGTKHEDETWMLMHEELCPLNPKNQPCATCTNMVLGFGCSKNMNMELVDGVKVKCFFYNEGIPQLPTFPTTPIIFDGNHKDDKE